MGTGGVDLGAVPGSVIIEIVTESAFFKGENIVRVKWPGKDSLFNEGKERVSRKDCCVSQAVFGELLEASFHSKGFTDTSCFVHSPGPGTSSLPVTCSSLDPC